MMYPFHSLLFLVSAYPYFVSSEKYFDINSYLRFSPGNNVLLGGDTRLQLSFRYCNQKGIILYQNSPNGYFALGVNNNKIYVEWKMSNIVVELYIGNGNLMPNTTYTVAIMNLNQRANTVAYINGVSAPVEYLITLDEILNLNSTQSEVFIGGFVDVSLLPVNTERLTAYLTICLDYIETAFLRINLDGADQSVGVYPNCPVDFCAPPTILTTTSTSSYVQMNVTVKVRTRTQISFKFRTRAQRGLLFYIGGPAYLTLFLIEGGKLGLGLNTKALGSPGVFSYSNLAAFNDGQWKYIQVSRSDNVANVTNEQGYLLITARFGFTDNSGFNLNADSFMIAGTKTPLDFLPEQARVATPGCFEAPRFVSYSISPEPASLLSYDTQIKESRDVRVGSCLPNITCSPQCPLPSQYCDFTCGCSTGYYASILNPLTCSNINDCYPNPCQNQATCVDLINDYNCTCFNGYTGKNCSQLSLCAVLYPCVNGGTCVDLINNYVCNCPQGFLGGHCEIDIDECASNPCLNQGNCTNGKGKYSCTCRIGFAGTNCESDINECQAIPCLNGATCINTLGSFFCQCAFGWEGSHCEVNRNECLSNPCFNNGTCYDGIGSYTCNCQPGFVGPRCETDINECSSLPCQNNGICIDGRNMYTCACNPGYSGINCEIVIMVCASNPCLNNGVCLNQINRFVCQCNIGFSGDRCEININECASNPCINGATCVDNRGYFSCYCVTGWTGVTCSDDINECLSNPCWNGGSCINDIGRYRCSCILGYTGFNCETNINECLSKPCQNGGSCTDGLNMYTCTCLPQWTGPNCADDFNECLSNPCQNFGTCINQIGQFVCVCPGGFIGNFCQNPINECDSNPCMNGVCLDRVNSFYCQCIAGYVGSRCEINYNECNSNPCVNGICVDGIGIYSCNCFPGWQGLHCSEDINECISNPCLNNAMCENLQNRYRCNCAPGFQGINCEINIDDCFIPTVNKCANNARCVDGIGTYTCICNPGWTGQFCDQVANQCFPNPCQNNGVCINLQNSFSCTCQPGFTGSTCSVDIDECAQNVCKNAGFCTNTYGSYNCVCQNGFTGKNCDSITNPCLDYTCYFGGTCEVRNNQPFCHCQQNNMGDRCQAIIRWCDYTYPCSNDAVCNNTPIGGYQCFCKPGFSGLTCAEQINECASNPCYNGGTCNDLINGYSCTCIPGYAGDMCKVDIDECASQPCQHGGVCSQSQINMYECRCAPGYTGVNCEKIIDNCASSPCSSWQICTNAVNNFNCSCPAGFTGNMCTERIDKCYGQPCKNGGTCVMQQSGAIYCQCPFPWAGATCENKTDACYPNPCLHFGTCIRNASVIPAGYICLCQPGFIGQRCQGDVYSCLSNPCKNNGQCGEWSNGTNGFTCSCTTGFTGSFCEGQFPTNAACLSSPCLNSGTCYGTTGYACSCVPGWTGVRCDVNINECISTPCLNGGSCQDTVGSYFCNCVSGWSGLTCNIPPLNPCVPNACPGQTCTPFANGSYICCPQDLGCQNTVPVFNPCVPNPCLNNGTCYVNSTSYGCHCSPYFYGTNCGAAMFTLFGGKDYIEIPRDALSSGRKKRQTIPVGNNFTTVEIAYITSVGDGLILYALGSQESDRPDYLLIELFQKKLRIAIGFPQEEILNVFPVNESLLEFTPTFILIRIENNILSININPCKQLPCDSKNRISRPYFMLGGSFYIGGVVNWTPFMRSRSLSFEMFQGCLGHFLVDNKTIPFIITPNPSAGTTPGSPGCTSPEYCSSTYCQNGGTCEDLWSKLKCHCIPSFTGDRCEHQIMAYFPGSVTFGLSLLQTNLTIVFEMTPNSGTGFILYTMSQPPISLFLENWSLHLAVWTSTGIYNKAVTDLSLSGKGWFQIEIYINQSFISLTANRTYTASINIPGIIFNSLNTLYVGSLFQNGTSNIWTSSLPSAESFLGCIRSFKINSVDIHWSNTSVPSGAGFLNSTKSCPKENRCSITSCSGRGNCISSWTDYTCLCNAGYTGEKCSSALAVSYYQSPSFTQISMNTSLYPFGKFISWHMRTREANTGCVIFVQFYSITNQSDAFLCFKITSGFLVLATKGDMNAQVLEASTNIQVNTGNWIEITVSSINYNYMVKINNEARNITTSLKMFAVSRSSLVTASIGNNPDNPISIQSGQFGGCVSNVTFNEEAAVPLVNSSERSINVFMSTKALTNCLSNNASECNISSCSGSGRCENLWNQFLCTCDQGFVGEHCESLSLNCSSNQCKNHASCVDLNNVGYSCICSSGYTGKFCENPLICFSNPCQNGGRCSVANNGSFECICQIGWSGQMCDTRLNLCSENLCKNNGTCYSTSIGGHDCLCQSGYNGSDCGMNTVCFPNPCNKNGSCSNVNGVFVCSCVPPYSGPTCDLLDPCQQNHCVNSTCRPEPDNLNYRCACQLDKYGRFCEFPNSCFLEPCLSNHTCDYVISAYNCPCMSSISITSPTSRTCISQLSKCPGNSTNCPNTSTCYVDANSLTEFCKCKEYFNGPNCKICNYCLNGGRCFYADQVLTCNCSATLFIGERCNLPSPCAGFNCPDGGICEAINSTHNNCITSKRSAIGPQLLYPNTGLAVGLGVGIPLLLLTVLAGYYLYQREQKLRGNYKPQETEQNATSQTSPNTNSRPFTISNSGNNMSI